MVTFVWVLVILASMLGGAVFLLGTVTSSSAPQQAAAAATGVGIAAIPYIFARAVESIASRSGPKQPQRVGDDKVRPRA